MKRILQLVQPKSDDLFPMQTVKLPEALCDLWDKCSEIEGRSREQLLLEALEAIIAEQPLSRMLDQAQLAAKAVAADLVLL